ncbi:MAG: hypothetical protein JSW45_00630, partial [Thiotrichales bacterium]
VKRPLHIAVINNGAPGEIVPAIHGRHPCGRPLAVLRGRADARPKSLPAILSNRGFELPTAWFVVIGMTDSYLFLLKITGAPVAQIAQ